MNQALSQAAGNALSAGLSPLEDAERSDRGGTTEAVYTRLFLLAHQLGPNAKLPAVRLLRAQFGVSQATLDAALGRLESRHILERRERSGVYVAARLRERSVCLLCSSHFFLQNSASPFWSLLIEHIRAFACERDDIRLSIAFIEEPGAEEDGDTPEEAEDPSRLPAWLREDILARKVQGVLAVNLPRSLARWIERNDVPVVAYAGAARHIIGQAGTKLVQMGVDALARHGCRRLHFWSPFQLPRRPEEAMPHNPDLTAAFAEALAGYGLAFQPEAVLSPEKPIGSQGQFPRSYVEFGWAMAQRCFGPGADPNLRPEAILSQDDMMTQGMLMAFPQFGIRLGRDIQIATYANKGSSALLGWESQLFRIEYDLDEFVTVLFGTLERLMDRAEGLETPLPEHYHAVYPRLILPAAGG